MRSLLLALTLGGTAAAQPAVLAMREPHHHLAYSDSLVRVLRVEVPPHANTLLHEHAVDYFWIAVGKSQIANAIPGQPEVKVSAADGSVRFTRGGFSHVARNEGDAPFFNVTLELLRPQTNPRNLCEQILPAEAARCAPAGGRGGGEFSGAAVRPEFETDQLRVLLLTIEPNATLLIDAQTYPPLLVNVDDTDGEATLRCEVPGASDRAPLGSRSGDVTALARVTQCAIRNPGLSRIRLLALNFKSASP
jgi:hypothetical protein